MSSLGGGFTTQASPQLLRLWLQGFLLQMPSTVLLDSVCFFLLF